MLCLLYRRHIHTHTWHTKTTRRIPPTPPFSSSMPVNTEWTSPDELFSKQAQRFWSSPLDRLDRLDGLDDRSRSNSTMTGNGSDGSQTPDFAFEPPSESNHGHSFENAMKPNYSNQTISPIGFTSNGGFAQPYPPYFSGSNSSFSSTSTGASFSSNDALPAISRNFHRPSTSETRRPATAGGALQSFGFFDERKDKDDVKPETIDEGSESIFSNPFDGLNKDDVKVSQDVVDPHYTSRRASDSQANSGINLSMSWSNNSNTPEQAHSANPSPHASYPLTSAPAHMTQFGYIGPPNAQPQMQLNRVNSMSYGNRPQTSDGLPSYGGVNPNGISLPPARTLVNQLDPSQPLPSPHTIPYMNGGYVPFRDNRAASLGEIQHQNNAFPGTRHYSMSSADKSNNQDSKSSELTFVPLGGPTPKKRPRRRYDEIERLYTCGWNGCEKAYGTLNHLNAHVAMQKHGEKRLPSGESDFVTFFLGCD